MRPETVPVNLSNIPRTCVQRSKGRTLGGWKGIWKKLLWKVTVVAQRERNEWKVTVIV